MDMPNDLTTALAASLLGIQPDTVKRLCWRGVIKAEKRGRDWFISLEEVKRYKVERRRPGRQRVKETIG
jgi:excisionase family DNA binding protein